MKTVVITGASRGIGAATAELFAQNGYTVAVNYHRNREKAEMLVQKIRAQGGNAFTVQADISDREQVKQMAKTIYTQCPTVDVLIHNAGIADEGLITETTDEQWRQMMGVHLDGAFYCTQAFLPQMISRHSGTILTVSSMWGVTGASCEVAYSAAKAGLIGFTKALAQEVGPSGVRVNAVAPGVIETDMCAGYDEESLQSLVDHTPLSRLGTAEDVAKSLLFLASDDASFITGQILGVNGGFIM